MILVYIMSFSVLITSGIYVSEAIIKADEKLHEKQQVFIKKTRSFHQKQNNDKGNITITALALTLIISLFFSYLALKMKVELKEVHYRKDSYLCFGYLNAETKKYINDMGKFNWGLRTLYAAQFSGIATAKAKIAFDAAKIARDIRHFSYVKNLLHNKYCKSKTDSLSFIKNFPFEMNRLFMLVTNIDATTILRKQQWKNTIYKNPAGIRLAKSFCLQASYQAKSAMTPDLKIETSEYPIKGFSKLKCSSGFL